MRHCARSRLDGGHRWCFIDCSLALHLLRCSAGWCAATAPGLRNVLADRCRVDGTRHVKCPGEGPAPLRESYASKVGMQPCASTGDALPWVGYDGQGNRPVAELSARVPGLRRTVSFCCRADRTRRHDDAEQLGGRNALPAPDARADRGLHGHRRRSFGLRMPSTTRRPPTSLPLGRPNGRFARRPRSVCVVGLTVAVDVDAVRGQSGRQPGILAFAADGE